jgi:hypothetical protein
VVPWSAVRAILADETTTFVNGVTLHEPHISVVVDDRAAIVGDRVDKVLGGLARHISYGDLMFSAPGRSPWTPRRCWRRCSSTCSTPKRARSSRIAAAPIASAAVG